MSQVDPIADMLTRIRNGIQAKKKTVIVPGSKQKRDILNQMLDAGYLTAVDWEDDNKQGLLIVTLKYDEKEINAIDGLRRISRQGRRVYVGAGDIPRERSGYGTVILSTSRGVLTDMEARKIGVGGEVVCSIW